MSQLDQSKLKVTFASNTSPTVLDLPRRYTLTHSDFTGELFLTIGDEFDLGQISGWYTRLMRDEVLAEWQKDEHTSLHVYCHVSGGIVVGSARWRYGIFKYHMPMVLQAFRYGDQALFVENPGLDETEIMVHFRSTRSQFNKIESWGTFAQYALKKRH